MSEQKSKIERKPLRICIMSGDVYPLPTATGVCVMALARALTNKGCKVDIICNGKENTYNTYSENEIKVHSVKANYSCSFKENFLQKLIRHIFWWIIILGYPLHDPMRIHHYVNMFKQVNSADKIDCLITCINPAEAACAGVKLKVSGSVDKYIVYQLDSIGNRRNDSNLGIIQKFKQKKAKEKERYIFNNADYIFELKCNEQFYNRAEFTRFASKIEYIDIPLISKQIYQEIRSLENKKKDSDGRIRFLYAGSLYRFRTAGLIIRLIDKLYDEEDCRCEFDFYTKAKLQSILSKESVKNIHIFHNKGYVSPEELNTQFAFSDFLISIGNASTSEIHEIPSKIFHYMSTGKPIIHISGGEYDACIPYFDRYSNVLLINPEDSFDKSFGELKSFIMQNKGRIEKIEDILHCFEENTAEYSARAILEAIKKI